MDVPITTTIICADQAHTHSSAVVLDPTTNKITHLIVREPGLIGIEHLVPVEQIKTANEQQIELHCTSAELVDLPTFMLADFPPSLPGFASYPNSSMWPYEPIDAEFMMIEHENIPAGEVALHRWAQVRAADKAVGRIDGFLVDATSNKISHLVLREGHLWGRHDVNIPVAQIDHIDDEAVYLKLSAQQIAALPVIHIHQHRS